MSCSDAPPGTRCRLVAIVVLSLMLALGSGCITQNDYAGGQRTGISTTQTFDADNDGINDAYSYHFAETAWTETGFKIRKQVAVAVKTESLFTEYRKATDIDQLTAEGYMEDFDRNGQAAILRCSEGIGLMGLGTCVNPKNCEDLCAAGSADCKKMAANYGEVLGGAMISYVKKRNEVMNDAEELRRLLQKKNLRDMANSEKDTYLEKTRRIAYNIALINTNPLYIQPELKLCKRDAYGAEELVKVTQLMGNYTTQEESYTYTVAVLAQNAAAVEGMTGFGLKDYLPADMVTGSGGISSQQQIKIAKEGSDYIIEWESLKMSSDNAYLLVYQFQSTRPPAVMMPKIVGAGAKTKGISLALIGPTTLIFDMLIKATGNYYISTGAAAAITLIGLLFLYNLVLIVYNVLRALMGKEKAMAGVRNAIGRTEVRWKTDLGIAVLLLLAGAYLSFSVATTPASVPALVASFEFLVGSPVNVAAVVLVFLGIVLLFTAAENRLKIAVLEQAYGAAVKEENDAYLARIGRLGEERKELEGLIAKYAAEEFDVSAEYDLLASLSPERVEQFAKDLSPRGKKTAEAAIAKIEDAVQQLHEKKKTADESWGKWKEMLDNTMHEKGEVYLSSLVTIPASLRNWAVSRYIKEREGEGIAREHDTIVRKKVDPAKALEAMVDKGLISTIVAMKEDKVLFAKTAAGSHTIPKVFGPRLCNYLKDVMKAVGQHEWKSFFSAGSKSVLVMMKEDGLQSMLVVPREKFNEAVTEYKSKARGLCVE